VPEGDARARETPPGTPHTAAAHRLVEAHAGRVRQRPPASVLDTLARHVDSLLAEAWSEPLIDQAIRAWSAKGLDASVLPSVANEVANRDPPSAQRNGHRPSATDAAVAGAQALKHPPPPELEEGQP
jgi:hypothetical protein